MTECLRDSELVQYYRGELQGDRLSHAASHLKTCADCAHRLAPVAQDEELLRKLREVEPAETTNHDSESDSELAKTVSQSSEGGAARTSTGRWPALDIEGYKIIREIGKGGMGVVYEAVQLKLDRVVALKILPFMPGAANREAVARFRREATAAARLHHTHIVPIYDYGQSGHTYYYAMELVNGRPLSEMVRRFASANAPAAGPAALAELLGFTTGADDETVDRPQTDSRAGPDAIPEVSASPADGLRKGSRGSGSSLADGSRSGSSTTGHGRVYFREVARWMADAADALHHAHAQGIIHRDIKPGNLMLSQDGRIMILDFGLAKSAGDASVTKTGSLVGTVRYMSPEQLMARRMTVDHRTDIYSLGATLYELLALQPAFQGRDEKDTIAQIITREPPPPRRRMPSVPKDLETICLKTLEKDAAARYATAGDLAADLRRYGQDRPIVARRAGPVGRAIKFVRRRRALSAAILATALLAVAVTFAVRARTRQQAADTRALAKTVDSLVAEGVLHMKNADWAGAEEAFTSALKIDPRNFRAVFNFATMKRQQYGQTRDEARLAEARTLFDQVLELEPDRIEGWNAKGVMLRMKGRTEEAIAAHKRGNTLRQDFYANWVSLASAYAVHGEFDRVEPCLLKAIDLPGGEDSIMAWHNLLAIQLYLAKPEALSTLQKLPAKAKRDLGCILLKARLYLQLPGHADPAKALRSANTVDELAGPDHHDPLIKRILALAELRNEHWAAAAEAARQALDLGDAFPAFARLILCVAEARQGHPTAAREQLGAARAAWPDDLETAGTLATAKGGLLWFESAAELASLRAEAESALAAGQSRDREGATP